uniref:C-type lectin domain-containing protein n=1 Tax=Plectus sambesii TaxID=2011161 RepID=A0A914VZN8_9BILA
MLFSLAILLFISPTVTALTDLQVNCTGTDRLYNDTSCYVVVGTAKPHGAAKASCNHYLGYSGHLVHIRSAAVKAVVKQAMNNYIPAGTTTVWTGLQLKNSSAVTTDINNWGSYYRNGTSVTPTYLPWQSGQPSTAATNNRAYYGSAGDGIVNAAETGTYPYVCEYEEALKQPVTDLEKKCANLTSSFKTLFVNDICFVMHPETKYYSDAKVACNDISGYNGHLAHARTMGDLWVVNALVLVSPLTVARLGIEHTNTSSTDMTSGWYLTTPTNQSELATFLPWLPSTPLPVRHSLAVRPDYPNFVMNIYTTELYPFICQYEAMASSATTTGGGRAVSKFNHYSLGYFSNNYYWIKRSTVPLYLCINMCHTNNLCRGFSYSSGTSDCQLLAVNASSVPYSSQLTADNQYTTAVRELL